ncbi:hypothetical protein SLA2020_297620 [Shorea laevis]
MLFLRFIPHGTLKSAIFSTKFLIQCLVRSLSVPAKFFSTQDVYRFNHRLGRLSGAGNIQAARQLFDTMSERDVVSWNAIVTGYWQNGYLEESKTLFASMPVRNVISWNSMIAGCVENDRMHEAFDYFKAMPWRNTASWNAMISGFVKFNRIEDASKLFEEMPSRNVISYTLMIDGYMKTGEVDKARALFNHMPRRNVVSWAVMISGYVNNGQFNEARDLYEQMPVKNVVAMTSMITGFSKQGMMDEARALFDGFKHKDLVSWNAIITGYAQRGIGEEALKLCSEMIKMGMQPDNFTLISVLSACSGLASLKEGMQIHVLVIKDGFESDISICNSLITMYSKCGCIHDSELAFRQIRKANLISWNTIIAALAQHGLYRKAIAFFKEMEFNCIKPDGITFLSLLSACGHAGKVNESTNLFDLMVKAYGIAPRSVHYSCLIDILCRGGQLDKACKVIQEMPVDADAGVWGALLAACNVYLNIELGELAAKKIVDLNPQNSGAYVMLSNMYARAGMWDEVIRVRVLMKDQGVKKQRGYSWLEIGDKMHLFLGGDISHPDTARIHLELKRISLQMKAIDDIAETVLLWSCFG